MIYVKANTNYLAPTVRDWFRALLVLLVITFSHSALTAEDQPKVKIEGVSKILAVKLGQYVQEPSSQSPSGLRYWQRSVQQRLTQVLAALGYDSARVESQLIDNELNVNLTLGPATTYGKVEIKILGEGAKEGILKTYVASSAPLVGEQLVHADYEGFKADLLSIALTLGYFDAAYESHRLAVSRKTHNAEITLILNSGVRYRYGSINFDQSELSQEFLHRWVPFQEGELYDSSNVDTLAGDLRDSGYFGNVRVRADLDNANNGTVPIQIESTLREPHSATVGIGYGSDSGPRIRGSITRHYVNQHGHSAGVETILSATNQELSTYYSLPHHPDPANHYLQLDAGVANDIDDDVKSLRYTIGASHRRIDKRDWLQTYSLKYQHEISEIDNSRMRTQLLIPSIGMSRERTKQLTDWGTFKYSVDAQLSMAREEILSDLSFERYYLRLGSSQAFSPEHLLHTRLELGRLETENFSDIPLSLRFYAGGDDSIRGFGRREVSPQDADGNAIGGRYLSTISLEYEYRVRASLGIALFVDAGRAGFSELDPIAYGGGFGVRWYSPVGPIKLYLGAPLKGDEKSPRFHLSVGN